MSFLNQSVSGKDAELFQDLKLDATQNKNATQEAPQNQKTLKLPSLTNFHKEPNKLRASQKKFHPESLGPNKMFDDNNIRSAEFQQQPPVSDFIPAGATSTGSILKKNKAVLSQKELDAQKILKVINGMNLF